MVDTLAFLKNDYSEDRIRKLIDEINTYVTFFGGYGAVLMKTTSAAIYREKKEGIEVPEDVIIGKLSADMLAIQKILDEKEKESLEAFYKYMSSDECKKLMKARNKIADDYLSEHDGYTIKEYEPNKYVINARLNLSAYRDLASLLDNMGIEYTDIVQWWSDEFDQDTAFEFIEYEPKKVETNTYDFWLVENYSEDEIDDMLSVLTEALKQTRYGVYHLGHSIMRATANAVVKVPIIDEYKKLRKFEGELRSELLEDVISSGEFDGDKYTKVMTVVEKEADVYCHTHHVFDEHEIKQGQLILQIHIVDEDIEAVKGVIQNAGYQFTVCSISCHESMSDVDFEYI